MAATSPSHENGLDHRFNGCSSIGQYEVLGKLGEGTFGEVHKARSKRTGAVVALKKILMHHEKDGFPITALREIKLLKMLSHVNVLRLEEMAVERSKGKERKKAIMYMVTPYMDHDLSGLLDNPDVHFTEAQIKCYMLQLLEGVRYLHESHILHRDMKAANLLINNKGILQIADFGLARHYDGPVPQRLQGGGDALREYTTLVVTRWYRPPELLLSLRRYTTAIDMWGVGCVFGEMFKRQPILAGKSDLNQAQIIFDLVGSPTEENMPGWSSLPGCEGVKSFAPRQSTLAQSFREIGSSAISLLSELLTLDWRKRITAIDALEHPYFRNNPLPAKPSEIPTYEESHELDRRKFRDQKEALPPAPAGGTVGMGPNGELPNGAGYISGPPSRDPRGSGWPVDKGPSGPSRNHQRGGFEQRNSFESRPPPINQTQQERLPPPHDEHRRIPNAGHPPYRPGWQGRNDTPASHPGLPPRPPPSRIPDVSVNGNRLPAPRSNKDTYIPSYSDADRNARPLPRDDQRLPRDERDHGREYRSRDEPYQRDWDGHQEGHYGNDRRNPNREQPRAYGDRKNGFPYTDGSIPLSYGEPDHRRTRSRSPDRGTPSSSNRIRDRKIDGYTRR